jgi:hypothetical protein
MEKKQLERERALHSDYIRANWSIGRNVAYTVAMKYRI